MSRKRWILLLVIAAILVFGYIKLFYKTWTEQAVAASADQVLVIDVKRVTNTLLWQLLTSPGDWKFSNPFAKKSKDTSWRDMIRIPDYLFAFHSKGQPPGTWYALLDIKSKTGFDACLKKFGFRRLSENEFTNDSTGVYLFVQQDKMLAARAGGADSNLVRQVASELFTRNKFMARAELQKAVDAKSHLAVYISPGNMLKEAGILTANFNRESIKINGLLMPAEQYAFNEEEFSYSTSSVANVCFTQPSQPLFGSLDSTTREKISKAVNLHADSLLLPGNRSYSLVLQDIKERADSAISYTFDDDFNKVEKLVVNNIQEPSFCFVINGKNTAALHAYLLRNNKLEHTAEGELFLPMPLVKSYCREETGGALSITAFNYLPSPADTHTKAVFFLRLSFSRIPGNLLRYLPGSLAKSTGRLDELFIQVSRKEQQLQVTGMLTKNKNSPSLIRF